MWIIIKSQMVLYPLGRVNYFYWKKLFQLFYYFLITCFYYHFLLLVFI